jgi:hypothetical protein
MECSSIERVKSFATTYLLHKTPPFRRAIWRQRTEGHNWGLKFRLQAGCVTRRKNA